MATPENYDEVTILIDAMVPNSLASYIRSMTSNYRPFKELYESRLTNQMPTMKLTRNQLRWIGRRIAPWERHTLPSVSKEKGIKTAHQLAMEIAGFLDGK